MTALHPSIRGLEMPDRIRALRIDDRGWPVPWFVAAVGGKPDHRLIRPEARLLAIRDRRCWICGEPLGARGTFVIGPMCGVTRTTAEPAAHRDCGEYAVKACPFLSRPHAHRRDFGELAEVISSSPGIPIDRNPGVVLTWTTRRWRPFRAFHGAEGILIEVGNPETIGFWKEGRIASPDEIRKSIAEGVPALEQIARAQDQEERTGGRYVRELREEICKAEALWLA